MKILVLGGGNSSEREVSLRSAAAVREALAELGHEIVFVDPADGDSAVTAAAAACDLVLPILHGTGGEDGKIQALLDTTGKPYLGSGAAASRLCFDKARTKELLVKNGIQMPRGEVVDAAGFKRSELRHSPFILKPVADGSSVGTLIAKTLPYDSERAKELFKKYNKMLLEELIIGTEITVPVLDGRALPVIEIVPPDGKVFDYENKYNGATSELCPPKNVSDELQTEAQRLAERAHELTGAEDLSRTDMMIDQQGRIFVLEINTMPGMTNQSLFPKAAAVAGMDWTTLVGRFVDLTLSKVE